MAEPTSMHVKLTPAARQAVEALAEITGLSRTDCINRALQLARAFETEKLAGKTVKLVDAAGNVETLTWGTTPTGGPR